jgi:hypothetical protein
MKKNQFFLLLITVLQLGCNNKNNRTEYESVNSADMESTSIENVNNNSGGNKTITNISYTEISKSEYETLKEESKNEILTFPKEKIEQTDLGLSIKLSNGKILSFTNNDGEECESCVEENKYFGYSSEHKLNVYYKNLYEALDYYIINEDGKSFSIWWDPCFLKGGDLIFCTSGLLDYGWENGFQIYKIKDGFPILLKQQDLTDWIPRDAYWISDNELILIKNFSYDNDIDGFPPVKYCKLTIYY